MEKRSGRLKVFRRKTTSEAFALPQNLNINIYKFRRNSGATAIGRMIRIRSVEIATQGMPLKQLSA